MEIFRAGKVLAEQFRADNLAIVAFDQAAIGLMREEQLAGAPDDEWIDAAENDSEEQASRGSKCWFL